ncbi:M20/M25/M40 family metallo-hydrolase [Couchioplanes azureus]|uniref:M20/M25/M40 family metallo-hydrolase n=1 Tax=Couchioplanes caeruleus TaxID=56438 RepID=UPI00167124F8|nr:M20/M25/M40 family metallo-hydrolase [Couchioplanes caeruleus]GGQ67553.1 aminopeptidase [Couchioplanes caeruleus subsp. azureus]
MKGLPTIDAADRAPARPVRRGWAALAAVLVLTATGVLAAQSVRPPAAVSADAPAAEFSAGRAFAHVRTIAAEPHVAGSAANDAVRAHLLTTLRGLGLSPEVQDTVTTQGARLSSSAGGIGMARVRNVVALWPGTASTGRVFLVAHYDSAQTGPGANDDGAGTAAILEAARALTSGPRLRNDVVFVLTDAEEACLCGAQAFVEQHPLARGGGVVLNLEARGSAGPAIMFETTAANAALVGVFANAPDPVGTSFAVEVYRRLPNNTDFTAFRAPGFTGLNSAYIDGAAVYHTPVDTPAAMDTDSLQHHGANVLALARDLGDRDLPRLRAAGDATYFPVPGALVHYPSSWTWPLAAAAVLAVLVLAWLVRRRGMATAPRLLGAAGLALVPILAVPALAQLLWIAIEFIRPGYAEMPIDPYRPGWYRLAILALTAAVVCAWYALLRRRLGSAALVVAGLAWTAVLGLVLAALAPGGSYLTALPALAGGVAGIAAVLLRGRGRGPLGGWAPALAVTLGAAAGTVVLLPTLLMFFPALGMKLAAAGAVFAVLLAMVLLPVVDLLHPEAGGQRGLDALRARRRGILPALAATVALLACTTAGLAADRFDPAHPAPTHLMYALDADTNQARWLSESRTPSAWTARYVGGDPAPVADTLPAFGTKGLLSGPAQPAARPAPALTKTADTAAGDRRTVTFTLAPRRPVRLVTLHVGAQARVLSATVAGRPVRAGRSDGAWGFGFVFHAPPQSGIEVTLTVPVGAPLRLRAMDASDGLAALPGFQPRPADVGVVGSHSSEMLAVAKTYAF